MKTMGLLGGMSWESTATYYRLVNDGVKEALGGLHSASILLYSFDFDEIEQLQAANDWDGAGIHLARRARALEEAGADFLALCTNTMHKVAPAIEAATTIPLLHIADATGERLTAAGLGRGDRVGLLGTRFTMEEDFYRSRIADRFGIEVAVPAAPARETVHRVIYEELCQGQLRDDSRRAFLDIIAGLHAGGAAAVILGCTEIALLVKQEHTEVPLYDTTEIHAQGLAAFALSSQ